MSLAVVFITSNYDGNSEIMQGCKEAGIPAFGTLWDFVGVAFAIFSLLEADDIHLTSEYSNHIPYLLNAYSSLTLSVP